MKILQIGAYNRNIGDTAALLNIRKSWDKITPGISWGSLDIGEFWRVGNNVNAVKQYFRSLEGQVDKIIVGGGGLLEYGGYEKMNTHYKLPFNEEILKSFNIPVYFHGVGVNIFRGGIDYSDNAKKALQETIDNSAQFSVRNDGSYEKLRDWIGLDVSKVKIVPDPGLLHLEHVGIETKNTLLVPGIQPAFNSSSGINIKRFINEDNIRYIKEFTKSMKCIPHTEKDFNTLGKPVMSQTEFVTKLVKVDGFNKFLEYYKEIDFTIAMRGHGQLMSIGMNLPGIYFTTQDKVRDFSLLNGFEDYNVDIQEKDWRTKLSKKIEAMKIPNSSYVEKWYEIRNTKMSEWYEQDTTFIKTCQ